MKAYRGEEISLHAFFSLALDEAEKSAQSLSRFTPVKCSLYYWINR
jgi:hypothetical protein